MSSKANEFLNELSALLAKYRVTLDVSGDIYVFCEADTSFQGNLEFNYDSIEIENDGEIIASVDTENRK